MRGQLLTARALFIDYAAGPALVSLKGHLKDGHADLQLSAFRALAVGLGRFLPLSGNLTLDFNPEFSRATGPWRTGIGTNGTCTLESTDLSTFRWQIVRSAAYLAIAWQYTRLITRACLPALYALALFTILILSGLRKFDLSYPEVILALVPAPYVFRNPIAELIRLWGITKLGPVELQRPITDEIRRSIAQQVQDTVIFLSLNTFLVPRTKLMLHWLSSYTTVNRQSFEAFAAHIGVPPENMDNTWNALIASGCARLDQGNLVITEVGRRYVAYLTGQANPALPLR